MALGAAFRAANLSTAFRVRKVTQSASILIYEIQMEIHTRQHLCCRPLSTAVYSSSFNPKPIVHIETLCDFPFFFFLFFFFYFFFSIFFVVESSTPPLFFLLLVYFHSISHSSVHHFIHSFLRSSLLFTLPFLSL